VTDPDFTDPDFTDPDLTYLEVGATARTPLPRGYHHVVRERVVGTGEECFRAAAERLMTWAVHRGAGLRVTAEHPRVRAGDRVVSAFGVGRLRIDVPCRVVEVVEEPRRVGFAYGTLPGHPEQGEERFVVEWRADDTVMFSVRAFSRPGSWWVRLGGPAPRWAQSYVTGRYLRAVTEPP
jgi:uncharacterized protein (UPF0548 family)